PILSDPARRTFGRNPERAHLRQAEQAQSCCWPRLRYLHYNSDRTTAGVLRGAVRATLPSIERQSGACYRLAATLLKVPLKLVPTVPMMVMAATAISAAISPYSIAVTPLSSLTRREIALNTSHLHLMSLVQIGSLSIF